MRAVALALAAAFMLAGCVQLQAERVRIFVNPGGHLVVKRRFLPPEAGPLFVKDSDQDYRIVTRLAAGETSIFVQNESSAPIRPVLARLDSLRTLPTSGSCTVDTGPTGEPEYTGRGYTVVYKLDDLPAYSDRYPGRSSGSMYLHLSPGTYVLFSNLPGDWCRGLRVTMQVSA